MKTPFDSLRFSTQALAAVVGGTVVRPGEGEHSGLVTDSREAKPGNIFLALRGERMDGHNYIASAAGNGADCILAEQVPEGAMQALPDGCAVIFVPDTLAALGQIGRWYKNRTHPAVVAVTGSVGKTTTKQMIHAVLSHDFPTLKTEGNYNNEIGLPLTLLRLEDTHKIAVLEAGMNHAGELSRLSHICEPDIAVITNIGTSHIENLGSREGIRDAKLELLDGMKPGGCVILNGDEPLLTEKREELLSRGFRVLTFAQENRAADHLAVNIRMTASDCTFDLLDTHTGETVSDLYVPAAGRHNIGNASAAYLCGKHFGMETDAIRKGLAGFENLRQTVTSVGGMTFIEDCYNASPESMEAELLVLTDLAREKHGRAAAVLGDMLELGGHAPTLHRRVGAKAAELGISLLVTYGPCAQEIARGAEISGMPHDRIIVCPDLDAPETAAGRLRAALRPGDVVLFKASHAVALERVIALLKK